MISILVVEDEKTIRENIATVLEFEGYDMLLAENGVVGLDVALSKHPDLILCDVMMPEMSGFEMVHSLRQDETGRKIPFIFLTALGDRDYVRKGMTLGADDYLTKPFTNQELLAAVQSRLQRQQDIETGLSKQLDAAKEQLMSMVAHELRTPLISITMVQDIISRRLGQMSRFELEEMMETLGMGSRRLSHLVEQIVYMTQLEAHGITAESIQAKGSAMYVWQLLTVSVDLGRKFAVRNQDVFVDLQNMDNEAMVRCDAGALKYAFGEIIANAFKFSPKGGTIRVRQWVADDHVWISVVDEGRGIAPEALGSIFDPFHQLDRDQHEQQGIGMGLPLAKRIIELHHGSIKIDSVVGKGTQVVISLPL